MFGFYRKRHGRYRTVDAFHQTVGDWDAQIYGAIVGIGVPIMGSLPLSFCGKAIITAVFFALGPSLFWWIETAWIISEIRRKGLIDTDDASYQQRTMQFLYYGVILAVVVWALCFVGGLSFPRYGPWEWGILVHTLFLGITSIEVIYPLVNDYLQATSGQRRVDVADLPPGNRA